MHLKGKELAQSSQCIPVSHCMPCDTCVNHITCAVCLVPFDANPNEIGLLGMRRVELIGCILNQVNQVWCILLQALKPVAHPTWRMAQKRAQGNLSLFCVHTLNSSSLSASERTSLFAFVWARSGSASSSCCLLPCLAQSTADCMRSNSVCVNAGQP